MKKIFIIIFCFAAMHLASAQDVFIAKGKIEFERKVNLHKEIESWGSDDEDGGGDEWLNNFKKMVPQFELSYFNLLFENNKTLYQPGRELPVDPKVPDWFRGPANDNIVLTELDLQKQISQKTVYDNTFLITDSLRKVDWRITNDRRTIAGFECRKAVGRIMDSVYVIAFYTDQITVSGGPESFCGLPGMILGIAIPRINTTWFATKLELEDVKAESFTAPKKGKKMNEQQLMQQLQSSLKDWGKYGQRNIWKISI
ncbi:MAG TPA: GLPGLI family protein [Chitinophagaceae bacterium]|nr:GLPGLI family protein [Chitinophagaceae bacterium]